MPENAPILTSPTEEFFHGGAQGFYRSFTEKTDSHAHLSAFLRGFLRVSSVVFLFYCKSHRFGLGAIFPLYSGAILGYIGRKGGKTSKKKK
jgi:hypothetical protein